MSAPQVGHPAQGHLDSDTPHRYALTHRDELNAELAERKLKYFVEEMWRVTDPGTPFKSNYHIDAVCDHLEAVTRNEIKHLLVNQPPRTCKSTVISVGWPVWAWLQDNDPETQRGPELRFLFISYAESLAIDLAVSSRRVIESNWFQRFFGHHFQLTGDVNRVSHYENNRRGYRISQGVDGSATGKGGDVVVYDDVHNVKTVESDVVRKSTLKWHKEVMPSRLNDEKTGHRVVVMQRSHQEDVAGYILEQYNADGFEHLILPMEYEGKCVVDLAHTCSQRKGTSIGFKDPRTVVGELLHADRFPPEVVQSLKGMGDYAYSAQYQQRPGARQGNMFKVEHFDVWDEIFEDEVTERWRAWDKAATEGGGAYTVGVRMGLMRFLSDPKDPESKKTELYFVDDVVRGQWSPGKREQMILATARADGKKVRISIEKEGGSGGKESAESSKRMLAGYSVYLDNVSGAGSKEVRADPWSVAVETDRVVLLAAPWTHDFIEEHRFFPRSTYKDQVDAAAQAYARLSRKMRVHIG